VKSSDPFADLPKGHFGAILADPPWRFGTWDKQDAVQARAKKSRQGTVISASVHYKTMETREIASLPVAGLAAPDCCLFMWICWPNLLDSIKVIEEWGFDYKTCAFSWMKAHVGQIELFTDEAPALAGMGYWTRANSEVCLLATRGRPQRLNADVRQGIIAPRREHSRKPDGIHERIERLVAGPYLELFGRQQRAGWAVWGNQTDKFAEAV
jgi:N6-adenosine-specific RNA methylase IME4